MRKLLIVFLVLPYISLSQVIITNAGNHIAGFSGDGGSATSANLNGPKGISVSPSGEVIIADQANNRLRLISFSGIIHTIAGSSTSGYTGDGGPATSALLNQPYDAVFDNLGNIYFSDNQNNCIRQINTSGVINTVVGNGTIGYSGDGGPAISAQLNHPEGIHIDNSGNLFIADAMNHCVRKVDVFGIISTIAGNGVAGFAGDGASATLAVLNGPSGVTVDNSGTVYIADKLNNRIRIVDSLGNIYTIAGNGTPGYSGDGGTATSAELYYPSAVFIGSSGDLYTADSHNNVIRKLQPSPYMYWSDIIWTISTIAGTDTLGYSGDGGPAATAKLNSPSCVAMDNKGNLLVADCGNNVVRKIVYPPIAYMYYTSLEVCMDSCITLVNTSFGTVDSIIWVAGTLATSPHSDTTTICFPYNGETGVYLHVFNIAGVSTSNVTIYSISPDPGIIRTGNTLRVVSPNSGVSYSFYSIQWYLNSILIPGATENTYTCTENGTYSVSVTGACGPGTRSMVVKNVAVSSPIDIHNNIELFPNPTTNGIVVESDELITSIVISNYLGQLISSYNFSRKRVEVDLIDFPAGLYFAKINGTSVRKFLKQ